MKYASAFVIALVLASCSAQLRYFSNIDEFESSLQPVQGLYVKPSDDGETGDLFVAASEDDGVQTPWVADTSVKLMPQQAQDGKQEADNAVDKGGVTAGAAPKTEAVQAEQPQFVQVPQLFFSQLLAAASGAASGAARDAAAVERQDLRSATPALPPGFMQAWNAYAYPPTPQYVLVDPETWAQAALAAQADKSSKQLRLLKM